MQQPNPTNSNTEIKIVFLCMTLLIVPAFIALSTVKYPGTLTIPNPDPTPFGYTWSLALFLIPVILLGWWFCVKYTTRTSIDNKAFGWTIILFTFAGFALDIVFGLTFFVFKNPAATLGLNLPGYIWGEGWRIALPIEEFLFYYLGALFMLLMYIWSDVYWFGLYNVDSHLVAAETTPKLVHVHYLSLLIGGLLILCGVVVKYFGSHPYHEGFPAYWTLLIAVAVTPSAFFFPTIKHVVNWRAFTFTLFVLLLVSVLWEATLGVPYAWWNYDRRWMMGIMVDAWAYLPIEAVLMWFAAMWGIIIVFELLRIHFAKGQSLSRSLFGK